MVNTYRELQLLLRKEKKLYSYSFSFSRKAMFLWRFTHQHQYELWMFVRLLRICEFLKDSQGFHFIKMLLFYYYERKRNKLGDKLGLCIPLNTFKEGLLIDHLGSVVINPFARIGKNCHIHGDCCIGLAKNGNNSDGAPVLGNHVEIGWGAIIIGNISIADGVIIGANSVVTHTIVEPNTVWIGSPARKIK